jgi:hypothetical protein
VFSLTIFIEWVSTAIILVGVTLAAFNVYPLYVFFSFFGNVGWLIVGVFWKKWSLIVLQIVITAINIMGIYYYYAS